MADQRIAAAPRPTPSMIEPPAGAADGHDARDRDDQLPPMDGDGAGAHDGVDDTGGSDDD